MKLKFKKLVEHAVTPSYAREGDAGLDLTAVDCAYNQHEDFYEYGTGVSIEVPKGYVGKIYARSSVSKRGLMLANSVGIVDSGYRGELVLRFKEAGKVVRPYEVGERIGQLVIEPVPTIELEEVLELSDSERGTGGFGST